MKTDAVGNSTCYAYDGLHRLTSKAHGGPYANATPDAFFVYDSATVNGATMQNAAGHKAEAYTTSHGSGSGGAKITDEGFSYTVRGELSDVYESTPHSGGYYHTSVSYWANGTLASLSGVPGYTSLTYGVDGEGRLTTANQGALKIVCDATCSSASTTYNPAIPPPAGPP